MNDFRIERDSMGEVRLPAKAYYGAQTQRAVENFPISGRGLPAEMIHALGLVKWAAAAANRDLGRLTGSGKRPLSDGEADALLAACGEVYEGKFDDQFPIDVYQTGSGTSSNMNANEVIANRAIELAGGDRFQAEKPIQPNDHVNMGQSTNDMFPTAIHVAVALAIQQSLIPVLEQCRDVLAGKAAAWQDILKIGRTHLADATPLSLGQEFSGLQRQLELLGRARSAGAAGGPGTAGRRHGRGQRHQYPSRVRPPRGGGPRPKKRHPLRGSRQPFRGQRPAGWIGRVPRPTAVHRRHLVQRGQQYPLARVRAAVRILRGAASRSPAG